MGNKSSAATTADLTTITSVPTTETTTPTATNITAAPPPTTVATATTMSAAAATTTTTTITTTTTTETANATTPTPTITSTTPAINNTSTTPASTESTSKPTFYTVAKSLTSDADKVKSASSAYARWYKWSKFEEQKQDKGKILWYMGAPVTTTDDPSPTTTTVTMTSAKIGDDSKEASDIPNITAIPSFQLRSTAVYSPPHGDRVPSGRNELINTDTSVFKYYLPENRSKQTGGIHTKATMYTMNTRSKQTPLPTQSSSLTNNDSTNVTRDNASLPTFVSGDLQTDFAAQPHPSVTPSFPSYPPPSPPRPISILKNSSTVLSQDISNPLSEQTHDNVLEELRKRNKNIKDGVYRVKKVHILETNIPDNHSPTVSSNLPPSKPPTKASQSILRSEKIFFNQLFNRKK